MDEDQLNKIWILRKFLSGMNTVEGMEFLIDKIKKFKTNEEFIDSMKKTAATAPASSSSSSNS